jgi:hypothetical protein
MAEAKGSPLSPSVTKGALVQLAEDFGVIVPNIIPFQYNPATMTRSLKPWDPGEVDQTNRGAQSPNVQPYDPEETYKFTLELDATDDLADGDVLAETSGIASRIAAIQKLTEPSGGLFGDLIASAAALANAPQKASERATVPITLLVLGVGVILPVRVTTISIEIKEFTPQLYPYMAEVQLELRVLTPEVFKCKTGTAIDIAIAAYEYTRLQEDALAVLNIANAVGSMKSILPF